MISELPEMLPKVEDVPGGSSGFLYNSKTVRVCLEAALVHIWSGFWGWRRLLFLTWFRSCLMECCRVRMWLNSGLCRVSLRFPMVSPWVHSSLWTSLACRRSRAPSTCWRSAEDTEDKYRMSSLCRNHSTWKQPDALHTEIISAERLHLLGHFQTSSSLALCLPIWIYLNRQ